MKTKLILVEGIPGSGKSTTANFISNWLEKHGVHPFLHRESSASHPAALDGLAFLDPDQYHAFLASQSHHLERLQSRAVAISGGFLFNYWGMKKAGVVNFPEDLFDSLKAFDVYDTLSAEKKCQLSLARWQDFAAQAAEGEGVYVFECCFLRDPLPVFLGHHNCDLVLVKDHILQVAALLEGLNPSLVYLTVDSVLEILEKAVEARPQAWIDLVTEYVTGQGYGKANGLAGFEGVVRFYELLHAQQKQVIARLGWRALIVDVSHRNWDKIHTQIAGFLDDIFSIKEQ